MLITASVKIVKIFISKLITFRLSLRCSDFELQCTNIIYEYLILLFILEYETNPLVFVISGYLILMLFVLLVEML